MILIMGAQYLAAGLWIQLEGKNCTGGLLICYALANLCWYMAIKTGR